MCWLLYCLPCSLLLLMTCSLELQPPKKDYKGDVVIRVTLTDSNRELFARRVISLPETEVELWGSNDLFVRSGYKKKVTTLLRKLHFQYEITVGDMKSLIAEVDEKNALYEKSVERLNDILRESPRTATHAKSSHHRSKRSTLYTKLEGRYASYEEIESWLYELAAESPSLVTVSSIGRTHKKRNITIIKIGAGSGEKPALWIDGGIHAREWISPASMVHIINMLLSGYKAGDADVTKMLQRLDWYIAPVVNPDGYIISHTRDRFWRKNVAPDYNNSGCLGTDLNRNFNFHWGEKGASDWQCFGSFRGPYRESEPETRAMRDAITQLLPQLRATVNVHSYKQMWLHRWSYTNDTAPDYAKERKLSQRAVEAIRNTTGMEYAVGSSPEILYTYSGGLSDWAKSVGIKYTFSLELRDKGQYGFLLPADQIIPTGKELMAALKVVALQVISEGESEQLRERSGETANNPPTEPPTDSGACVMGLRTAAWLASVIVTLSYAMSGLST